MPIDHLLLSDSTQRNTNRGESHRPSISRNHRMCTQCPDALSRFTIIKHRSRRITLLLNRSQTPIDENHIAPRSFANSDRGESHCSSIAHKAHMHRRGKSNPMTKTFHGNKQTEKSTMQHPVAPYLQGKSPQLDFTIKQFVTKHSMENNKPALKLKVH